MSNWLEYARRQSIVLELEATLAMMKPLEEDFAIFARRKRLWVNLQNMIFMTYEEPYVPVASCRSVVQEEKLIKYCQSKTVFDVPEKSEGRGEVWKGSGCWQMDEEANLLQQGFVSITLMAYFRNWNKQEIIYSIFSMASLESSS